jgi:hypothetical protein
VSEPTSTGGSKAVQGCLFGAVALFAVLLIVMLILAYQQFREHTGEPTGSPTTGMMHERINAEHPQPLEHAVSAGRFT